MTQLENMTEVELKLLMDATCRAIEATFARLKVEKPRFALVVFNDPKIGQYASNCTRASMIEALRETAERLERLQKMVNDISGPWGARHAYRDLHRRKKSFKRYVELYRQWVEKEQSKLGWSPSAAKPISMTKLDALIRRAGRMLHDH